MGKNEGSVKPLRPQGEKKVIEENKNVGKTFDVYAQTSFGLVPLVAIIAWGGGRWMLYQNWAKSRPLLFTFNRSNEGRRGGSN